MKTKKLQSKKSIRKDGVSKKDAVKNVIKETGKFLHGTKGKPGRSPHGDKYY